MSQVTSGLRSILSLAPAYELWRFLVGAEECNRILAERFIRLQPGQRILDIGCGTARILDVLPEDIEYFGFDPSEAYIRSARDRYGDRGRFWAESVSAATIAELPPCDVVFACGVLHHISDEDASRLFELAAAVLSPEGRVVTYDPAFREGQSSIARFFLQRDRGQRVRDFDAYSPLARGSFDELTENVLEGHLRMPYTAVVVEGRAPRSTRVELSPTQRLATTR